MVAGREVTSPHPAGNTDNWSEKASARLGSSEGQEGTYLRRGGTLHFGHKCNGPRARGVLCCEFSIKAEKPYVYLTNYLGFPPDINQYFAFLLTWKF